MKCFSCNEGQLINIRASHAYQNENGYVVIENIPAKECDNCREKFFDQGTIERILEIVEYSKTIKSRILDFDYETVLPKKELIVVDKESVSTDDEDKYISYEDINSRIDDLF